MAQDALSFLHDSNAHRNPEITELRLQHGYEGYGIFWAIVEILRESTDNKIQLKRIPAIAYVIQADQEKLMQVVQLCIDLQLFCSDGAFFWSEGLNKRVGQYLSKRKELSEKRSKAAKLRWQKQRTNKEGGANAVQVHSTSSANAMQLREVKLSKEKKSKEKKREVSETEFSTWAESHGLHLNGLAKHFDVPDENDPDWVSMGRLPLKAQPQIRMSPSELEYTFTLFKDAGLPREWWKHVFRHAYTNCQEQIKAGKPPNRVRYIPAIQGYALTHVLKLYRDSEYTKKAKGPSVRPKPNAEYDQATIKKLEQQTGIQIGLQDD